ncbi:MAG: hypothetical protein LBK99_19260 [Opitutaceae bacterium]|nr:hypothetical protein [Opitutaceae bacterium]
MPKITRPPVKTFAGEVPAQGNVAQFGSLKAGNPSYSADPAVIQALAAWGAGWNGAVLPVDSPALQDLNALFYVITRALAYYMQTGIPEWDAAQTYYINSICQSNGVVYKSLIDDNTNNAVSIDTAWVAVVSGLSSVATDKESVQGNGTPDAPLSVAQYVTEQVEAARLGAFVREFNGEIGTGVDIIPDGSAPSVAGSDGDYYFTLAYEPTPAGEIPAGWLIIAWEYSDGFWDFSSQLLPIAAKDLHWVAVRNGDEVHGYYVMGAGGDVNHPPQWELIGAELSQYYTKSETDTALAAKVSLGNLGAEGTVVTGVRVGQGEGAASDTSILTIQKHNEATGEQVHSLVLVKGIEGIVTDGNKEQDGYDTLVISGKALQDSIADVDAKADAAQGTANDAIGDAATAQQTADLAKDAADAAARIIEAENDATAQSLSAANPGNLYVVPEEELYEVVDDPPPYDEEEP